MSIEVRRFTQSDRAGIERLNLRLATGGVRQRVYGEGRGERRQSPITERLFVATEGQEVRGAVWLREQPFHLHGDDILMGWPKWLVAESLVDARYVGVPRLLLRACLSSQPLLMGLGFGGHSSPMARLLAAHKWAGETVPFLFRVVRPGSFIREVAVARKSRGRRLAGLLAHRTGLAFLGWHAFAAVRAPRRPASQGVTVETVESFGPWVNAIWTRSADAFGLLMVRTAPMLEVLYPPTVPYFTRLRIQRGGRDIGWAVIVRRDFGHSEPDRVFGALSVGLVADVLACPEDASDVARAALDWLLETPVDVIFTNQSHPAWVAAFLGAGMVEGPASYAFYRSPTVQRLMAQGGLGSAAHMTRGDGDGPIWFERSWTGGGHWS